jgi:hypothetical protein
VLEELKPWDIGPSVPHKRDSTIYDLVSSETWLWGPGGEYSRLVVDMPDGFTHNWIRWEQRGSGQPDCAEARRARESFVAGTV